MEWIVIGALGALTVFLFLAVLGAMREIVMLRGDVQGFRQLIQSPPPPSFVSDRLPDALVRRLKPQASSNGSSTRRQLVAFVSPGCGPCESLVEGLSTAVARQQLLPEDAVLIVWAYSDADAERFARGLALPSLIDTGGSLSRACEVRATPTVFVVSSNDYRVLDYNLEGSTEWVLTRMRMQQETATAA